MARILCCAVLHDNFRLRRALGARAADGADVPFEIFGVVVVIEFFSGLDAALREDEDAFIPDIDLAVRRAGVIDEASGVGWDVAVDHGLRARPEEVFATVFLDLTLACRAAGVFDDADAFGDYSPSEKTAAAAGALYPELEILGLEEGRELFHGRRIALSRPQMPKNHPLT